MPIKSIQSVYTKYYIVDERRSLLRNHVNNIIVSEATARFMCYGKGHASCEYYNRIAGFFNEGMSRSSSMSIDFRMALCD